MRLQEARDFVVNFNTGDYGPEENAAFLRWLEEANSEELTIIADTHEAMQGNWVLTGGPSDEWVMQMERKLDARMEERDTVKERRWVDDGGRQGARERIPVVEMKKKASGVRWMAAASVAVLFSAGAYFYIHQLRSRSGVSEHQQQLLSMEINNPRGGAQKAIVLPDGSKVWLNAGSVLKYPPQFKGGERVVALSGEAFFDVTGSSGNPFRILIRDAEVEVLGTYFDVMAYDDEPASHTTLVEGAVKVTAGQQMEVLHPGEQAEITYSSPGGPVGITVHQGIDTKLVMAWKDGIYRFSHQDLRTILRELGRMYNVTVEDKPDMPNPAINGILDLHLTLDTLLEQLQGSLPNNIQLKLNNSILTVTAN